MEVILGVHTRRAAMTPVEEVITNLSTDKSANRISIAGSFTHYFQQPPLIASYNMSSEASRIADSAQRSARRPDPFGGRCKRQI